MKFRFRILSANKRRQRDVRNFGVLLLIIGFYLHDPGQSSLKYLGILLLLWSGMSWLVQKAWTAGWFPDSVWVHVIALAVLVFLDIRFGHIVEITESAIVTFSEQMLQRELSEPPEKRKPGAKFDHGNTIRSVAFSPVDDSLLASAGGDTVKLWNRNAPDTSAILRLERYTDDVQSIAFSADGERLATGGPNGVVLWNVPERSFIETFDYDAAVVAFSPDGQRIAEAAYDLRLWDITDIDDFKRTFLFEHQTHRALVESIAFSPDGKWLASADTQGDIKVWDVQNEPVAIPPLNGGKSRISSVKFSPVKDNLILASAGADGDVKLWGTQDWQILHRISTGTVLDLAFSPNGDILAGAGWETVDLWAIENGAHILSFKESARSVVFSSDGTTLATGGTDGVLRIWDVPQSVIPQQLMIQDVVRIIYFLPKGSRPQLNIRAKIDKIIRKVQHFYAEQIESHRLDRRSFTFETDESGKAQVYLVTGEFTADYYLEKTLTKVDKEIEKHFDVLRNVYFVVVELGSKRIVDDVCGQGGVNPIWSGEDVWQASAGFACIPTFKNCFNWQTAAHELGHAFGLQHDFRDDNYLMSYGKTPDRLSQSAAHWLFQTRFFKPSQEFFDKPTSIEMLHTLPRTQFEITDTDGIHQVQLLLVPTDEIPPSGYEVSRNREPNERSWEEFKKDGEFMLQSYYKVDGETETVIELPSIQTEEIKIQIIDTHGNITWRKFNLNEGSEQPSENL
jgi:WD40 repeat protein